jgi:energy-coupling factor transport system permease protein
MRVILGNYLPRSSFVHSLDPRVKLFLMGLGIGVVFHLRGVLPILVFFGICLLFTVSARIPLTRMASDLAPFIWLFVLTAVLNVFLTPGDPIFLPHATRQGVVAGIRVSTQLVLVIWISTLTTLSTSPFDMVRALEWYLNPLKYLKVPVDDIALIVMLALRFIPLLFEETDRIIKAQKARGVDLESGGVLHRLKSFVPVLVLLLQGVFRRADDLAVALSLRGYAPGIKRTRMKEMHAVSSDYLTLCAVSVLFAGLLFLS